MSLFKKLVRGSSLSLAEQAIKIALMFLVTPLMIRHLGEEDYGVWLLALAVVAYFHLLDLGLSFSGARFLGKALGANDRKEFKHLVGTFSKLFIIVGFVTVLATIIAVLIIPLLFPRQGSANSIQLLVAGFGALTAFRYWTRIFEVVLKGHVRYDLISIAGIARAILQGGFVILALVSGYGITSLLLVHLAGEILYQLLLILFAKKIEPGTSLFFFRKRFGTESNASDRTSLKELFIYSSSAVATSAGHSLRNGVDPIIIARISGVDAVPTYSIGARFLSVFADIINAIFGGNFVAAFSQLHGRGDTTELNRSFLNSIRLSAAVATLGGAGLMIFGTAFIERWVGSSFSDSSKVLMILTVPTLLSLMQYPVWGFFYSQNKQHWLAMLGIGGGFLNLILSILLALSFGFFGVVWATLIETVLAFGVLVPLMVVRVTQIRLMEYLKPILFSFGIVSLVSLLYYLAIRQWILPEYFRISVQAIGLVTISVFSIWTFVLTLEERTKLRCLLQNKSL